MKQLIFVTALFSIGILAGKAFGQGIVDSPVITVTKNGHTEESINALWESSTLVCLKNGRTLIKANKAYLARFTNVKKQKEHCFGPNSKAVLREAKKGYQIVKLDISDLPTKMMCRLTKDCKQ
jgi:hypothetical protein